MKNRILNRLSNLLMLLLCILPLTALLIDSFDFTADASILLWAVGICLLLWFSANFRRGMLPGLILSSFLLFAAYKKFAGDLRLELTDFFDRLTGIYYEHYYDLGSQYPFKNEVDSHTFILLLIVFFLAAYMSMSLTSKSGRTSFSLLGSLPVFAGCIAINGRPQVLTILCLMLFWTMLLSGGNYYGEESNQGRIALIVALPTAVLLFALVLWQKPEEYDYEAQPTEMVERFDKLGAVFSNWMNGIDGGIELFPNGETEVLSEDEPSLPDSDLSQIRFPDGNWGMGDGSLELERSMDSVDQQVLILRARAETDGYLYLRNFSFGDYTGTGWLRAEEPDSIVGSSLAFTAAAVSAAADSKAYTIDLRFSSRPDVAAIPYYSTLSPESDSFVPSDGERNYSVDYYSFDGSMSMLPLPTEYVEAEAVYRSYAHRYYTSLPESTKSQVLSLIEQAGISADSPELIAEVAAYVKGCVSYDIGTSPYPTGDYAVYFLQEAETGYCIHYATAAAVIYRALGIPARVTDGFLFQAKAGEYVDVLQGNEHAWVEVYVDGLGWIPVEVTGSAGFISSPVEETPELDSTPAPAESDAPAVTEEPLEEAPPAIPTPQPSQALPVGIISQPETQANARPRVLIQLLDAILYAILLALLLGALPVERLIRLRLMQNRISQRDRRKAAVWIWKYASRTSKFGAELPDCITKCAEKAAFSPHEIGAAEYKEVRHALYAMIDGSYAKLSPFRKFVIKFIYALK